MTDIDFLIYFESYEREYENSLLMKWELERRGYSVFLCNTVKNDYWRVRRFKPKVVAAHTLRNNRNVHAYVSCLGRAPRKLVDLQYEQVIGRSYRNSDTWVPTGKARKAMRVCWGNETVQRLTQGGIDAELLKVTGAMQMDTLRTELRSYYLDKVQLGNRYRIDSSKTWVLFNAGFTVLTADAETLKKIADRVGDIAHYVSIRAKIQETILEWIDHALSADDELVFIYRPHPGEKPTPAILEMLAKNERFVWNGELSVKQWILAADVVCVWNSTSVVESYYAQRPTIILRPIDCKENDEVPLFDRAQSVNSFDAFLSGIRQSVESKTAFPIPDVDIERYYGSSDAKPAFVKVCDLLEDIYQDESFSFDYGLPRTCEYFRNEIKFKALTAYSAFVRKTGVRLSWIMPFKRSAIATIEDSAFLYSPDALNELYEIPLRRAYEESLKTK